LVFFDTTSLYFEGRGGETIDQRGHNKDHRPYLKQMVVGMAVDVEGRPICCEMWPGNTVDVTTLVPIVKAHAAALPLAANNCSGRSGNSEPSDAECL
jgi:transposase